MFSNLIRKMVQQPFAKWFYSKVSFFPIALQKCWALQGKVNGLNFKYIPNKNGELYVIFRY